ncbi:MAG: HlyD family efflux transporter periplasmic adaptor subunit [Cyanobacteriota bacterium]|nr:HlyD family efflux transporter periplasmic adaptor subunit [Cyanobacteriota bacterium]
MTHSKLPEQNQTQYLKVVPPSVAKPTPPQRENTEVTDSKKQAETPPPQDKKKRSLLPIISKIVVIGAVAAGGYYIGMMPVSHTVTGKAEITSTRDARQLVTMPFDGTVTLKVDPQKKVKNGEIIAEITSLELENQIAAASRILEQAKVDFNAAEKELIVVKSRLEGARTEEAIARTIAEKRREELLAILSDRGLPKTRQFEHEIDRIKSDKTGINHEIAGARSEIVEIELLIRGTRSEIAGLQNQSLVIENEIAEIETTIKGKEGDIEKLQNRLSQIEPDINKLQELAEEGLVGTMHPQLVNFKEKKEELLLSIHREESAIAASKDRIRQKENQLAAQQEEIKQKESQLAAQQEKIPQKESAIDYLENQREQRDNIIAAKAEEIAEFKRLLEEEIDEKEYELEQRIAARKSLQKEAEATAAAVVDKKQLVEQSSAEIQRLEQEQEGLTLKATTSGTVVTSDLDLLSNRKMKAGDVILNIVNLQKLTASVQISQEDIDLVEPQMPVEFKPRDADIDSYSAKVLDIPSVVKLDESGQNPVLTVTIGIDNQGDRLRPGLEGYAHIKTEEMRIYQKITREFLKLFPWWKL